MAVRQHRTRSSIKTKSTGLLACGSSGGWTIDINETTSGPERWFAQIEGPSVYLYFEIPASLPIIDGVIRYLDQNESHLAKLAGKVALILGGDTLPQIKLIRDDEFPDRYFLTFETEKGLHLRFTLAGEDLKNVTAALRQARKNLET